MVEYLNKGLFLYRKLELNLFSLKNESKLIKITLFLSCLLLFSLILFSIFHYGQNYNDATSSTILGKYYEPNNDDVKFMRSARILAETGNYTYHKPPQATVFMMPGLPFTLAFFMKIFGEFGGITALRILQAITQVLSLLLVFYIARKIFNSRVAIVAVALDVLCIAEVWVPTLVLTEALFKFLVLCLIYFSIYAIEEGKVKLYILAGIFFGLSVLFRPTIGLYPIIVIIMWIIKKVKLKDAIKYTAVVSVVFAVILSPWWIRNYTIFHRFIPFTLAQGNPMVQGTAINYGKYYMANDGLDYTNYYTEDPKLSEIQRNDMEVALSKYRLKTLFPREPLKYIYWYTIGKGWIQIKDQFYWKEILGVSGYWAKDYYSIILISGVLGIALNLKSKKKSILVKMPMLVLAYFVLVYLPYYTMCRYFYPAVPYLMMFSAYFMVKVYDRLDLGNKILHRK